MIIFDGIAFQIINVLLLLMQSAGPTPVAGTNGTTASFLSQHSVASHAMRSR